MDVDNICYLYSAEAGVELISCKNWAVSYPLHNHVSVLTIGIILDGTLILTTDRGTRICKKSDTFTIFPYVPHSILAQDSYTLLSLCIDKNVVNGADAATLKKRIGLLLMQALKIGKANDTVTGNGIVSSHSNGQRSAQARLLSASLAKIDQYQISQLSNCLDEIADPSNWQLKKHTPYIHGITRRLESYPECRLTVEEMAQNAFISKYHFIRSFKAEVGLTPHQFQIQNRIRKAQRLIHKTDTMTEVALATGFYDQSHFIKQFEKQVGLSPLAYKASSGIIPKNTFMPSGAFVPYGDAKEDRPISRGRA